MLHQFLETRPSIIEGRGLFATAFIPRGTTIWKGEINKNIMLMNRTQYEILKASHNPLMLQGWNIYAYYEKELDSLVYSIDDMRFTNHSTTPNVGLIEGLPTLLASYALKDIQAGEEITANYLDFDLCPWEKNENMNSLTVFDNLLV
jgi:SET domain-containing protein